MNAISHQPPPVPARTERQLRQCQRLAELGMDLAEATAALAKADLAQQLETQQTAEPDRPEEAPQPRRRSDPAILFVRLSRAVRQAIVLENRIAAGAEPARAEPAHAEPARRTDPRREKLRGNLISAIGPRADLLLGIYQRIDDELDADADALIPIHTIYRAILEDLGLPPDTLATAAEPPHQPSGNQPPSRPPPSRPPPSQPPPDQDAAIEPSSSDWPWQTGGPRPNKLL